MGVLGRLLAIPMPADIAKQTLEGEQLVKRLDNRRRFPMCPKVWPTSTVKRTALPVCVAVSIVFEPNNENVFYFFRT
jgi:hypothetical protein